MRNDETQSQAFVNSRQWDEAESRFLLYELVEDPSGQKKFVMNSFSGNERNRLFLNTGENFQDATTVSGADFREDGRGFVLLDYDRDGWLDMGICSAQRPRFRLMRNRIGDSNQLNANSAFIKLMGGAEGIGAQSTWSPKDPYGAELFVSMDKSTRAFQLSGGEGLSSQNSQWIHIGMGEDKVLDRVDVIWPSGKKTSHRDISAGERVTLFENPDQATQDE